MKIIKIGIVGLGPHFRETLLSSLIGQDDVILSAFCDSNPEAQKWVKTRFSQALVVDQVSNIDFWSQIDCVVCCSWPTIHEQVLALAIKNSKHCFCEKPVASSTSALDLIMKNPRPESLIIRVGHTLRYMGGAARFVGLMKQGELACLEVTYLGSGPIGSRWEMLPRKSFSLTHLTHAVDFVTAIAGRIRKVRSVIWASGDTESVAVSFRTDRCPLVSLFATNAANAFTCKASGIFVSGATVHLDNLRNVTITGQTPAEKRSGSIWKERDLGTNPQNDGYMDELRDFFSEIRGTGRCILPDLDHAKHVLEVVEDIESR